VYTAENSGDDATLRPSYVYWADAGTVLTNSHLYESPTPGVLGAIYSPGASSILSPLQVPHLAPNAFSGFVMSNYGAQAVNIAAGEAADSTGSSIIQNIGICSVSLATGANGAGRLDTGSVATTTTYFYFAIAASGGTSQNCIASKSQAPTFDGTGTTTSPYALNTTMSASHTLSDSMLYNVASVTGIQPGDEVAQSTYISSGTHVSSVGTLTINSTGTFVSCSATCMTVPAGDYSQMRNGMLISDGGAYSPGCSATALGLIGKNTTITLLGSNTIQLSTTFSTSSTADCITVSGGNVIFLDTPVIADATNQQVFVYTGIYRMVGALYTDGSYNLVKFAQDGDTFYLAATVEDIPATGGGCTGTIGNTAQSCQLSVPCGRNALCGTAIAVEAFGRIASAGGSAQILASNLDQNNQAPTTFGSAPGNTSSSSNTTDAYPFRFYTSATSGMTAGAIRLRSTASAGTTVNEVTDGWVFKRDQH
jgi:hypothetical protein